MVNYFSRSCIQLIKKCNLLFFLLAFYPAGLMASGPGEKDSTVSGREEAIRYIERLPPLQPSPLWPAIKPSLFLENIKDNIQNPMNLYEGNNTNFCGYAALSYLVLQEDPLGYAKCMIRLFREGKAGLYRALFRPSAAIRRVAGALRYKGMLDIRPADQLWFLSLADHFKGYLNLLNPAYDPGDEDKLWAAVNYGKFNRMVRKLLPYQVRARGSDLLRPAIRDIYAYLRNALQTGYTVLYVNNTILHRKNYNLIRADVPTHYIILLSAEETTEGLVNIVFWDYGFRTLRQLPKTFLKKIIFGITHCTKKPDDAP